MIEIISTASLHRANGEARFILTRTASEQIKVGKKYKLTIEEVE